MAMLSAFQWAPVFSGISRKLASFARFSVAFIFSGISGNWPPHFLLGSTKLASFAHFALSHIPECFLMYSTKKMTICGSNLSVPRYPLL